MKKGRSTLGNHLLIRLDKENDTIRTAGGLELFIDTTFEPEKHVTVTGEVVCVPKKLFYSGDANKGMPWMTDLEVKIGDKVVMYYLSVLNAFRPEYGKYFEEDGERYVFINYQFIYAVIRDGKVIPVNGYCLVEPHPDPFWLEKERRIRAIGLEPVRLNFKSNTHVVFGKVKHIGQPNKEYTSGESDEGCPISEGDVIMMRKISDVFAEYELHASIDGGKKYYRIQRRHIIAKI